MTFLFISFLFGPIDVSIFYVYLQVSTLYSKDINIYSLKMKNVELEMPSIFSCVSDFDRPRWEGGEGMGGVYWEHYWWGAYESERKFTSVHLQTDSPKNNTVNMPSSAENLPFIIISHLAKHNFINQALTFLSIFWL